MYRRNRKSTLFLIELIISIFFFSICCGVCVQLFAKASVVSRENENRAQALLVLQSAQNVLQKNTLKETGEILNGRYETDKIRCEYDREWCPTQEEGCFFLEVSQVGRDDFDFHIYSSIDKKTILRQKIVLHSPLTIGEAEDE
ncbi:MAG: hypothetical protein RR253_01020 [Oscillospiraceae bacterium]